MKTIASVVENYIKTKPFLLSALSQGIINLTSLARIMMPELQEQLGKDVKQGAVVMALKRLSEDLDFRVNHKIVKVLKNIGEITVRSSLIDYTYGVSEAILERQSALMSEINQHTDIFYTSSRGVNETNIVVSASVSDLVEQHLRFEKLTHKLENLSSITVKLP
ncbi:MAG: aspartate kinase, partial [Flavobacterium sp.]